MYTAQNVSQVLENNHNINFYINKESNIEYPYINSVLKELHIIHNELKKNNVNDILNVQTCLKNNILYTFILDNN